MKFSIKQVGFMFAILAIVVLSVVGVFVSVNYSNSIKTDINASGDMDTVAEQTPEIILLTDDEGTIAEKWNRAVKSSIDGNREVFVQLGQNWNADLIVGTTSFGEGLGFVNGAITVVTNANIKLDLNGYTIDRRLGTPVGWGCVLYINGTFTLLDSKYDRDAVYGAYNESVSKELDFKLITTGKITGGSNVGNGGGIIVSGGTFIMESGMISGNIAKAQGGGIYGMNSEINIKDGIICENAAFANNQTGGGFSVTNATTLNMAGGIVYKNVVTGSNSDGAGICIFGEGVVANISNVLISKNINTGLYHGSVGGAICVETSSLDTNQIVNISNTTIEYNSAFQGSGIAVWNDSVVNISNCNLRHNTATEGGGIYVRYATAQVIIKDTNISNNIAKNGGGGAFFSLADNSMTIGKGTKITDNYNVNFEEDDFFINSGIIRINGEISGTKIGLNGTNKAFTSGYGANNSTTDPSNYFYSNTKGKIVHMNSAGEVELSTTIVSNEYDFIYLDNGVRKSYKNNNLVHGNNDFNLRQTFFGGKMILGNISPNTSVAEFIGKLEYGDAKLVLTNQNNKVMYGDGAAGDYSNYLVGTGWNLKVYTGTALIDNINLSVLGDITGDGKVNSLDVTYLRRMIKDNTLYTNLSNKPYIQLAALLLNNGKLTNADGEILWNIVCGKMDIEDFI